MGDLHGLNDHNYSNDGVKLRPTFEHPTLQGQDSGLGTYALAPLGVANRAIS